jgi:hypothetical protein
VAGRSRLEKLFEGEWEIVGLISCDPSFEIGNRFWIRIGLGQGLRCESDGGKDARPECEDWRSE